MLFRFLIVAFITVIFSFSAHAMSCSESHEGARIIARLSSAPNGAQLLKDLNPHVLSRLARGPRRIVDSKEDNQTAVQNEKRVQAELETGYEQWKRSDSLTGIRRAFEAVHKLTGNAYESAVRMKRIALGERFYRLMRAGDVVRAVNYVRRLFDLRPHAEAMLWAQLRIHQLENDLQTRSDLTESGKNNRLLWIERFKRIVEKEAKHLRHYGDMKMIVYQFNRLKIKFDNSTDPRLKNTMLELSQKIIPEKSATENLVKELIIGTENQLAQELGTKPLSKEEIEKYINERIMSVSGRVSEMPYLRSTFPDLFRIEDNQVVAREYKDAVERSINLEADFVGSIYHGHFLRSLGIRGYGQDLPARATAYRELAWESLGAIKNVLGVAIKAYGALARSISRNNLEAIIEIKEEQSAAGKTLGSWKRGFNQLSLSSRKALKWVLDDLMIYDALNLHAPKIDILENLLQKKHAGFETNKSYVDMIRTFAASEGGVASNKAQDFFVSFARIEEYADVFRESVENVRAEAKEIADRYKANPDAALAEQNLLKAMEEAWKITNDGTVSRISLHTEPNMVSHVAKQIFTFGAGTVVTVKGVLYAIDPAVWTALKEYLPTIF